MKRLHIGMICDEYPPVPHGGIGSVVCDLAEGLVDRDHIITVVGSYDDEVFKTFANQVEFLNNVRVVRLKDPSALLRFRPRNVAKRLIMRAWMEVEHQHNPFDIVEWPDYGGLMPWGLSSCPGVVRLHGSNKFFDEELHRPSVPFEHRMEQRTIRAADYIFSVSRYAADKTLAMVGLADKPFSLVYNAVDTRVFCPSGEVPVQPGRIVFVNSLSPKKGIEELCQAVNFVFERVSHAHLVIVGRTARVLPNGRLYTDYLLEMVRPEFRDRIQFTGSMDRQTGVLDQLRRAEVTCLPSHLETFGIAAVEAMAVGLPVIFSQTGPGREIIQDGVNGFLCDPMNPREIADKLIAVLENAELRRAVGQAARDHVLATFDREAWITRNIEAYEHSIQDYLQRRKRRVRSPARNALTPRPTG